MSSSTQLSRSAPAARLAGLRAELDRIDDALHDALMRRAEVVTQVAAVGGKGRVPLRPGREAQIVRRLLARNRGALRPDLVVRIWREILSGSSLQQHDGIVAVDDPALRDLAISHFGLLGTVVTAPDCLDRLARGDVTVAVRRWPGSWWPTLLEPRATPIHVVARLPFWGGAADGAKALVLTAAEPDPSGDDRTLIAAPQGALAVLPARPLAQHGETVLAEVDGFLAPGDPRLPPGATVLGAYATPANARSGDRP